MLTIEREKIDSWKGASKLRIMFFLGKTPYHVCLFFWEKKLGNKKRMSSVKSMSSTMTRSLVEDEAHQAHSWPAIMHQVHGPNKTKVPFDLFYFYTFCSKKGAIYTFLECNLLPLLFHQGCWWSFVQGRRSIKEPHVSLVNISHLNE